MIIKNEEKHILRCVESALKVVDELIIVDTGSTDSTLEILGAINEKGLHVYHEQWENDFSKARNLSISKATGEWILVLDGDEIIQANREVLELFLRDAKGFSYNIPIVNLLDDGAYTVSDMMIRLFRNDDVHFEGEIHEQLYHQDRIVESSGVLEIELCKIFHYGYLSSSQNEKQKFERNVSIIKNQLDKEPKNPFHLYNYGVVLMNNKQYQIAFNYFSKSKKYIKGNLKTYHNDMFVRMAECMIKLGKAREAISFLEELMIYPVFNSQTIFHFKCAEAYQACRMFEKAKKEYLKCLEIGDAYSGFATVGVGSFLARLKIAEIFELENKAEEAISQFVEAVFDKQNKNQIGLETLRNLLVKNEMYTLLEELEISISVFNNDEASLCALIEKKIEMSDIESAWTLIESLEKINSRNLKVYNYKAILHILTKSYKEALGILNEGIELDADDVDFLYNKAFVLKEMGDVEASLKCFTQLLDCVDSSEIQQIMDEINGLRA